MHIPKTAGVVVHDYLSQAFGSCGYRCHFVPDVEANRVFSNGKSWLRNFTMEEMVTMTKDPAPLQYFKNHTPWSEEVFRELNRNGWFVFSFVRHPGDLICSWHHYFGPTHEVLAGKTLDESVKYWFRQPLEWLVPDFWREIDFIRELSEANTRDLIENHFGLAFSRFSYANLSANLGYEFYCRAGEISKESQRLVESHEQFERYLAIRELNQSSPVGESGVVCP